MQNTRLIMHTDLHSGTRRDAILRILRGTPVRKQDELVRLLRREGHEVTQSSISRDLRELGVLKASGRYLPPTALAVNTHSDFHMLRQFVRSIATARSLADRRQDDHRRGTERRRCHRQGRMA